MNRQPFTLPGSRKRWKDRKSGKRSRRRPYGLVLPTGNTQIRDVPDIVRVRICKKAAARLLDGRFQFTYLDIAEWLARTTIPELRHHLTPSQVSLIVRERQAGLWHVRRRVQMGIVDPATLRMSGRLRKGRSRRMIEYYDRRFENLENLKDKLGPMPEIPPNRTAPNGRAKRSVQPDRVQVSDGLPQHGVQGVAEGLVVELPEQPAASSPPEGRMSELVREGPDADVGFGE